MHSLILILPLCFCPENGIGFLRLLHTFKYTSEYIFSMEANNLNPDQTASIKYSKTCLKGPLQNRQNKDLNDKWYLNEGRKYCRMLPLEHSAILLTCIMQSSVLKKIGLLFEWLLKTGFTV